MSKLRADITYKHRLESKLEINLKPSYNDITEQQYDNITKQQHGNSFEQQCDNITDQQSNALVEIDPALINNDEIPILDSVNSSNFLEAVDEESLGKEKINEIDELSDDKEENMNTENFDNYLQEWLDMLEEEKRQFDKEEVEKYNDDEFDEFSANEITYPAIDTNAK
ncbi:23043_t:CDS:1 [Gigaspora rosea]|nr:23043_t:CDS:1 [Gigaspora rosea]